MEDVIFPPKQFPPFIFMGRQQENTIYGSCINSHRENLAHCQEHYQLVSAASVEKGQELDPIKSSFQGHFFPDLKLHLQQCFSGSLPLQASIQVRQDWRVFSL